MPDNPVSGTGRLLYIIGPSGAGKDSVLAACHQALTAEDRCLVAHRYITRPPHAGAEQHVPLSDAEFAQRSAQNLFCLQWDSNGHRYGIGIEVQAWLERGLHVLVNGSREYLPEAQLRFPQLLPVLVWADPAVLRERLLQRGRETPAQVEARLTRATRLNACLPAACQRIDNSAELASTSAALLRLIRSLP